METSARHLKWLYASLLLVAGSYAPAAVATDDPELNVWVADAPTDIVVRQLAEMTGRELVIDGALSGKVSGRFKGTVRDALSAIAEQTPVLFDISDVTLSATDDSNKIRSSIVAGDNPLDEATRTALVSNLTPGNDIEFRDNEVIVSGHPVFVRRTAMTVTAAFADTEHFRLNGVQNTDTMGTLEILQGSDEQSALAAAAPGDNVQKEPAVTTPGTSQDENSSALDNVRAVSDAGSQELIKDMRETLDTGEQVVAASSQLTDDGSQRVMPDVPVEPDAARQVLLQKEQDRAAAEPDAAPTSTGAVQAPSGESGKSRAPVKEFQWVTDIPGFDTF